MPKIKNFVITLLTIIYIVSLAGCASRVSSSQYKTLGYSALAIAIKESNLRKVQALVSSGADIHKVATIGNHISLADQNQPALQIAAEQFLYGRTKNKEDVVKYLLEQGADPKGDRYADKRLNFYDKSGFLASTIGSYRVKALEQSRQSIPVPQAPVPNTYPATSRPPSVSIQAQQFTSELEQMKMEIAQLKAQLGAKNQLRTALVIGNSQYSYAPLNNPRNDAQDLADALRLLNFDVTLKIDSNLEEMETSIHGFAKKLHFGGVGLFYFAGHGVQFHGDNYLIPINANINNQSAVKYNAVSLGQVLESMGDAGNDFNIAIIDACRNNPLPKSVRSSGSRGLARIDSPADTLLAFSTSPGKVASDGVGRNGLYTEFLLKHIRSQNTPIEYMLKRVARDVKKASSNRQTPWMESSFTGDFSF